MKYYTFKRESNNFDDILSDNNIKPAIRTKISWVNHIMLGFSDNLKNENIFGYIVLKYGENIINPIEKDFTPIPNIDYIPIQRR
jgi:hypothetical protein